MTQLFLYILNESIMIGWVILGVILLRKILRKAPKWIHCSLWIIPALRLIFPVSLPSIFSLIPSTQVLPADLSATASIDSGSPLIDSIVNPAIVDQHAVHGFQIDTFLSVAGWIWLAGIGIMLLLSLFSYLRLWLRVRISLQLDNSVYICDAIDSPFVFGLFRPKIYLPSAMESTFHPFVMAHEQAHIRRRDHWWKPLGYLFLTLHWFNPLLWIGYCLLCRDIEQACDDKVIQDMSVAEKQSYSQALLSCSIHHRMVITCPVAFGEVGVKTRVRNILHYKKPSFWILLTACLALTAAAVCFLTDPLPCNHEYEASTLRTASCTSIGVQTHTCTLCGHSYAEPLALTAHSYDQGVTLTDSTCCEAGTLVRTCTQCGDQCTEALALTSHTLGSPYYTVAATCVKEGHIRATCSVCKQRFVTQTLPVCQTHDLKETVVSAATCTSQGQGVKACTHCDYTEQVTYPATDHNLYLGHSHATCCQVWYCSLCNTRVREEANHVYVQYGSTKKCKYCSIPAPGTYSATNDQGLPWYTQDTSSTDPYPVIIWDLNP